MQTFRTAVPMVQSKRRKKSEKNQMHVHVAARSSANSMSMVLSALHLVLARQSNLLIYLEKCVATIL
jgi:hypothetical protein